MVLSPELYLNGVTATTVNVSAEACTNGTLVVSPNGNVLRAMKDDINLYQQTMARTIWPSDYEIRVELDDRSYGVITRDELVKYICDRSLREQNEVIRTLWDRYTVAIKLVRSNENDSNGS